MQPANNGLLKLNTPILCDEIFIVIFACKKTTKFGIGILLNKIQEICH